MLPSTDATWIGITTGMALHSQALSLQAIRDLFPDEKFRRFDAITDTMPREEVTDIRAAISSKTGQFIELTAGLDVDRIIQLLKASNDYGAGNSGALTTDGVIEDFQREGKSVFYHGTNALMYAITNGVFLGDLRKVGYGDSCNAFHMSPDIRPCYEYPDGIVKYLENDGVGIEILERAGIEITDKYRALHDIGIILAIDISGYSEYKSALQDIFGVVGESFLEAPCAPPSRFVKPIVALDLNGFDGDLRGYSFKA